MLRAAKTGDLSTLRTAIADHEKAGNLANDDAADLAKATLVHEIASTPKPADAADRVRDARACAYEIDSALRDRMKTHDEAGAEAALARLEAGQLDEDDARNYAEDADAHWRSVGARAMTREEDEVARERLLQDPSPLVRRQAVRAAMHARDAGDLLKLADIARLDPDDMIRSEAVRALATQPARPGQDAGDVADRLRDLWPTADDALREDIAMAWASKDVFANGGRDALLMMIAGSKDSPGVMEAAAAVEMTWAASDPALGRAASAQILRAIGEGSVEERLHAIAIARFEQDKGMLDAINAASTDSDAAVRVAALSRLLNRGASRADAVRALEVLAGQDHGAEDAPTRKLGSRALFALAAAGDVNVQKWLEDGIGAKET